MSYVMEHEAEVQRLEKQAKQNGYRLEEELKGLQIKSGEKILDAGCGTGLLLRHLKANYQGLKTWGVDASDQRLHHAQLLDQAKILQPDSSFFATQLPTQYLHSRLESTPFENHFFDRIISRYVYEHLERPLEVTQELHRILTPGGELTIVDFDGIFLNLFNGDKSLEHDLIQIQQALHVDLFIGRKIPWLLKQVGFHQVRWEVQAVSFKGADLKAEIENCRERLHHGQALLERVLGSREKVADFSRRYLSALEQEEATLFYNKFVVHAKK